MEVSNAAFMVFDVLDNALLDVIFGSFNPSGELPFEIPSSMEAVRVQREDVPFDTKDPIFKFGFGLSYP
jgi:beta-glucosidase